MFLSFIVPVYNTEKYLAECLDSLLNQDIPPDDYEIICVNDGSTDGSLAILQKYKTHYNNVHVISKENGGVASARNMGLDMATADYIWFFDSDDVIKPNILGTLRTHIAEVLPDRLMIGTYFFTGDAQKYIHDADLKVNSHFYDSSVCNNILSRQFLNLHGCIFRYPALTHGEDSIFMFEVVAHNPRCVEFDFPVYFYRNRPGSAMTSTSEAALEKKLRSHLLAARIMKQHYDNKVGNPCDTANLLMSFIWYVMSECASFPNAKRKPIISEMKFLGLYPFQRPSACSLVKSYQTTRIDIIGKTFDWIYIHTHTRLGFKLMCIWQKAYSLYKKCNA